MPSKPTTATPPAPEVLSAVEIDAKAQSAQNADAPKNEVPEELETRVAYTEQDGRATDQAEGVARAEREAALSARLIDQRSVPTPAPIEERNRP